MNVGGQHWFVMSVDEQSDSTSPRIHIYRSTRVKDGRWSKPVKYLMTTEMAALLEDPLERKAMALLGARTSAVDDEHSPYTYAFLSRRRGSTVYELTPELYQETFPLLQQSERFGWVLTAEQHLDPESFHTLQWDAGAAWRLQLSVQPSSTREKQNGKGSGAEPMYTVATILKRDEEWLDLSNLVAIYDDGLIVLPDRLALVRSTDVPLIRVLMQSPLEIEFPGTDLASFMSRFVELPHAPDLHLDPSLQTSQQRGEPVAKLVVAQPRGSTYLHCDVRFVYDELGDTEVSVTDTRTWLWDESKNQLIQRDLDAESDWLRPLHQHPLEPIRFPDSQAPGQWRVANGALNALTRDLVSRGWQVVAEGRRLRSPSEFRVEVKSGIDWFNLEGTVDFDGALATLPALLRAIRRRQNYVILDDGSHGILPDEWLQRYAGLADLVPSGHAGKDEEAAVKVPRSQALLLELLLAEHEQVVSDLDYRQLCDQLKNFQGIIPIQEPNAFKGELRPYQRDGLGWMSFLREFGFGGCLADDMGLGKTVQVLAMLEARRTRRLKKGETRNPTLAVVPKSLIFNWIDEAARFVPNLDVVNYTGPGRKEALEQYVDLIVTTYGTLRQDIQTLKDREFDYVILDEAQAIKNAASQAAQCCRLLKGQHRLAMTGTPVENHLGELWSLFEFLNPGMISNAALLKRFQDPSPESPYSLQALSRTLRPFMLRRTKEQVLTELPEKTEQTLFCEMTTKQRQLYDELRKHYQLQLSEKIKELGLKRSKIHVLEALLRLRQAACDPRLLDNKQKANGAKIEALLEQIESVVAEGHKALVFSQFTSLLALVRSELDSRKIVYEYLDGKTTDRKSCVRRFQEDAKCPLFLISLKAGGHGLNLTAADYVFILDPWWNPAVEAQAIDRAYRLGQTRHVMAYRIICKDTVEEKILELQATKRELADAIVADSDSLISQLSADDLALLLG